MNWFHRAIKIIDKIIQNHSFVFSLTKWLLLSIPPSLITYANSRTGTLYQEELKVWFTNHPYWFLACFLVPLLFAIWLTIYTDITTRLLPIFEGRAPKMLLAMHNRILDEKLEAIKQCHLRNCKKRSGSITTSGRHFIECALRPKYIIKETIKEVSLTLQEDIFDNKAIKVVLAELKTDGTIAYHSFYPTSGSHIPTKEIVSNSNGTFFQHIIDTKQADVIPDIEAELRKPKSRYKRSPIPDHNKGSIIGIPIFCNISNDMRFLLTVKSDVPKLIGYHNKEILTAIFEPISKWLLYDHNVDMFSLSIS